MNTKKPVNHCISQHPRSGDRMVQLFAKERFEKSLQSFRTREDLDRTTFTVEMPVILYLNCKGIGGPEEDSGWRDE